MAVTRRKFVNLSGAYALSHSYLHAAAPKRPPNLVLIMADDHGAWASGAYGCPDIHTPNIDRLAQTGTKFTQSLVCTPVCSPSRMTYLTGQMPSTHGVQDYLLREDSTGPTSRKWLDQHLTYTEVLARNGYNLGMCGKWHMGQDERAQAGFSDWSTVPSGGGPYKDPVFVRNGKQTPVAGFREDAIGDFALEFLDKQKNSAQPFCLSVNFYAPHIPYNYQPEKYRTPYDAAKFSCFPDLPADPEQNKVLQSLYGKRESKLGYSALITALDANVGRILDRLTELSLREDTLVVLTADHGWNAGHHGLWGKGNGSIPLNMYEESLRVPLIWNHPGRIPRGKSIPNMVSSYDFFPSILDYLALHASPDARRVGASYIPLIQGAKQVRRERLYFEYAYMRAVRTGTMKYVERTDNWKSALYDLSADPHETRNLLDHPGYQDTVHLLQSDLHQYFEQVGAPPIERWRTTTQQHLPEESNQMGPPKDTA
jgi:arylsulfatase A-like enzyme